MANTYKNIVITPNIGNTSDPRVQFSGGNTTANTDINLYVYPTANGTLSFEGSAGQLFSITNDLANLIFSVSDVSGIPSLEVYANSLISVAPFGGNVVFGNTSELILSPGAGIYANGGLGSAGQVLTSNGTSVYWSAAAAGGVTQVNTGNGMTGGPITTTGTVSVVAGNSQLISNSTGIWLDQTQVNHNSLTNYVADQHVAHSTITLTAGAGLTGGGTIAANRTFDIGAGNGMAVDADSIRVVAGTGGGLVSNATGVFALQGTGTVVNATGIHLPATGPGAGSYSGGISAVTLDAQGRVTAITGSAGYVTSSGVTSVAAGTGLSGGTITGTGTLLVNASYIATIAWPINGTTTDANTAGQGIWRMNVGAGSQPSGTDYGTLLSFDNASDTGFQLASDYTGSNFYWRSGNPAVFGGAGSFATWKKLLHDSNFNSYSPTLTGTGASGTWGISVTGTAYGKAESALNVNNASYAFNYTQGFNSNWNTDFSSAPAGSMILRGDTSTGSSTGGPGGTWWFQQNFRHTNSTNVWGTQVAWGWEDNANILRTRNVTSGTYGAWVTYLNSSNYNSYAPTLTGTGASGNWGINITGSAASATGSAATFTSTTQNSQFNSLGVGTAGSGTAGEIRATNNVTAYYSDKRLKANIQPILNALDKINKISGVTFQSNEEAAKYGYTDKKTQVGVIAQEIEAVLPEVVVPAPFDIDKDDDGNEYSKSGQNYKTVQYEKLVPLLIEAIKELSNQVEELKKKVENKDG